MLVWSQIQTAIADSGQASLVTVISTKGSSPREAGARMIVRPDGSFNGTIGGGALEWQAIAMARSDLLGKDNDKTRLRGFALGPELAQCCGGHVDMLFERFGADDRTLVDELSQREAEGSFATRGTITDGGVSRIILSSHDGEPDQVTFEGGVLNEVFGDIRRRLFLFGAGHVGRAIVLALAPLPFEVNWVDPRADAFPSHIPANVEIIHLGEPEASIAAAPAGSFALVMTHSHPLDLSLVRMLLMDNRFDYVGLIGSDTKRTRFRKRLADGGVPEQDIDSLVCPIGRPGIRGKAPAVIAASVVSDLVERDEVLRAEHEKTSEAAQG
jgi:xanthine dehydrogenase accessory factor